MPQASAQRLASITNTTHFFKFELEPEHDLMVRTSFSIGVPRDRGDYKGWAQGQVQHPADANRPPTALQHRRLLNLPTRPSIPALPYPYC